MTLQLIPSEFPYICMKKILFYFLSVWHTKLVTMEFQSSRADLQGRKFHGSWAAHDAAGKQY
jgi:hypothetical protein